MALVSHHGVYNQRCKHANGGRSAPGWRLSQPQPAQPRRHRHVVSAARSPQQPAPLPPRVSCGEEGGAPLHIRAAELRDYWPAADLHTRVRRGVGAGLPHGHAIPSARACGVASKDASAAEESYVQAASCFNVRPRAVQGWPVQGNQGGTSPVAEEVAWEGARRQRPEGWSASGRSGGRGHRTAVCRVDCRVFEFVAQLGLHVLLPAPPCAGVLSGGGVRPK